MWGEEAQGMPILQKAPKWHLHQHRDSSQQGKSFFPTPNGSTVSIEKPSAASSLHSQPSWDALLDQCLGGEKLSFLSFTESQFDRAIGACNSYSEWAGAQKRSREALSALQALCQPCAASKSRPREMAYVKGAQNRAQCCSMEGGGGTHGEHSPAWGRERHGGHCKKSTVSVLMERMAFGTLCFLKKKTKHTI